MATQRQDVRERVRDYLHESVADIWTDEQLNRHILEELRSLPSKSIYLEEMWTTTCTQDQQDYALPTGTIKVESVEKNEGTTSAPNWCELKGADFYGGALYLPYHPSTGDEIRVKIKKSFDDVTADDVDLSLPDYKIEVLVWGTVIRAYRQFIGYLRNSESWDTVTKPGDHNISTIQNWIKEAQEHYKMLIQQYMTSPKPRDINLTA